MTATDQASRSTNSINKAFRKVYRPLGFHKGSSFTLFFIFAGALMGFTLARFMYLDFNGIYCSPVRHGKNGAAPGECYWYLGSKQYTVGIIIHLACVLPAAFLAVFQFIPAIRRRWILVHRVNGYIVISLFLVGVAGALMITRHAFGGGLDTQSGLGMLAIMSVGSLTLAYVSVKRFRIDQHRAWMLRAWFYAGSIVTIRIVQIIGVKVISALGTYYLALPCAQLLFTMKSKPATLQFYPECAPFFTGKTPNQQAIVHAIFTPHAIGTEVGAAFSTTFGMAVWLSLAIHAIGVEAYLHFTPAEGERLRKVSRYRQAEAGMIVAEKSVEDLRQNCEETKVET